MMNDPCLSCMQPQQEEHKRCELNLDGPGCIKHRIQYAYWEGWSHGEILFRYPSLKALDKALRAQEKYFIRHVSDSSHDDGATGGGRHEHERSKALSKRSNKE